jgi:uncharacterized membrane protein
MEDTIRPLRKSLALVPEKLKQNLRSLPRLIERDGDRLIFVPILVYTIAFSAYTCFMNYVFKTYAWDLGIVEQSLWTTLNSGKILYSTPELSYGNPSGIFLGVHFSPILFLILPVYAIYQSSESLLIFQSFILAIAALPLYWLARDKLDSKLYGFAIAIAYLLNPALQGVNTFDFHVEIFTPVFFLFAFYYLDKGKWLKALPFLVLELMTVEFAPFIVFFLGLYFFLRRILERRGMRQRKTIAVKKLLLPVVIMIVSVSCLFLALNVTTAINPTKAGGPVRNWSYWGNNFFEQVGNMIRNPTDVVIFLFTPIEKPYFLIFLLACVLFTPLLAPLELIMSLPWLAAAFLSDYQPYYQPYYQYSAFIIGQLFIAGVFGLKRLFSWRLMTGDIKGGVGIDFKKKTVGLILALNVLLVVIISPVGISTFTDRSIRPYAVTSEADVVHAERVHDILNLIPADASIATIMNLFPHLCQRLHAYILKWPLDYDVDYILVDLKSPFFTWGIQPPTPNDIVTDLLNRRVYGPMASADGVLLLKRNYTGPLQYFSPQEDHFDYTRLGSSDRGFGTVEWDYTSASEKVIVSNPTYFFGSRSELYGRYSGMIWYGPYQYYAPGNYTAIFRLKTANQTWVKNDNEPCDLLLQVTTDNGYATIAQRAITGTDFNQTDHWEDFSVNFEVRSGLPPWAKWSLPPLQTVEFRGKLRADNIQVAIDYVKVEQLSP